MNVCTGDTVVSQAMSSWRHRECVHMNNSSSKVLLMITPYLELCMICVVPCLFRLGHDGGMWRPACRAPFCSPAAILTRMLLSPLFTGYVQTPGFDGISKRVLGMDSWLEIDVPMDHIVMISFVHIDLPPVSVESNLGAIGVYTGSLSECDRQQYIDTKFRPDPEVYDTRALFVHFYTNQIPYDTRGFQMLFSIHNSSARPEKLSEGKWNCSVSFWSDFRQHFPCNLHGDCADGRDEEDCPYTSTSCGPERLSIGSRCCFYCCCVHDDDDDDYYCNVGKMQMRHDKSTIKKQNLPLQSFYYLQLSVTWFST